MSESRPFHIATIAAYKGGMAEKVLNEIQKPTRSRHPDYMKKSRRNPRFFMQWWRNETKGWVWPEGGFEELELELRLLGEDQSISEGLLLLDGERSFSFCTKPILQEGRLNLCRPIIIIGQHMPESRIRSAANQIVADWVVNYSIWRIQLILNRQRQGLQSLVRSARATKRETSHSVPLGT